MAEQYHYVSGFFATRDEAQQARAELDARGLPPAQLQLYETHSPVSDPPRGDSNAVLKDVVVDGAIGTAVGTGLGALAQVALIAGNVSLFIASPLLAPLVMMGWGASIGGLLGASVGAAASGKTNPESKEGWLSALVSDAISKGQVVLVAETRTPQERTTAREVIEAAVGACKDVVATA